MKKQIFISGLVGVLAWGVAACSTSTSSVGEAVWGVHDLRGSQWVDADPVAGQVPVSLEIAKDAHLSGHSGCNRYQGRADIVGTSLRLVQGGSTRMLCFPPSVMDIENRFGQALARTRSAKKEKGFLLLLDEAGQVLWRFKPRD
jgi:heat shock protein HslJ